MALGFELGGRRRLGLAVIGARYARWTDPDLVPRAMGRKQKTSAGGHPTSEQGEDAAGGDKLFFLRTKYSLLDKAEWWWLMDDSLAEINSRLETEHFVVIDGFLTGAHTRSLRDEIKGAHEHGHLAPGVLAGGKAGDSTQYTMRDVRGDHVGWFDGTERLSSGVKWSTLPTAMKRADTLVNELGALRGSELASISSRSKAMCTVYPGDDARYVRHVDNPDGNGRLLTALLYLNPEWEEGDGGELRVFRCLRGDAAGFVDCDGRSLEAVDGFDTRVRKGESVDDGVPAVDVAEGVRDVATLGGDGTEKPVRLTDVAPLGGRLVLFKSNARVPHEVLAARAPRYAMTLWYFDKSEVTAARAAPLSEEERKEREEKIAREIEFMRLKHGVTAEPEVRVRDSREAAWRDTGDGRPKPEVPGQCSAAWEDGDIIAITVPLPSGTGAGDCGVEIETTSSTLVIEAPGLEGGIARIKLPDGADENTIAVKLSKKPTRALVVRVKCEGVPAPAAQTPPKVEMPPVEPEPTPPAKTNVSTTHVAKDCVGVGGTLSWSSSTDFSKLPAVPPRDFSGRERGTAPRGADLRDASDWEDFIQTRWALAGKEDEQPVLTPHALDGLSFPVTLAWALQQPGVSEAVAAARKKTSTDVAFASLGDETTGTSPLVVVVAGASAFTEQHLLDHTRYWDEVTVAAPQPAGGIHLAFVGPDVRASSSSARRLSPTITASVHRETVRDYMSTVPSDVPLMICGFNTGMGGGGGALARGWAPDLVEMLRRTDVPAVFTAANDYADLKGELAVFKALGARFIVDPRVNPFKAFTHTIGEGDGKPGVRGAPKEGEKWSCANAFVYAVRGFAEGKGPSAGLSDDQLCTLATKAAERAAGAAWDALGMRRR